jgi:Cdc6-like AAA superfamily ATPase
MGLNLKLAEPTDVRLKMYIYGESGTGKTVSSCRFME